jgi:hypothetical protein
MPAAIGCRQNGVFFRIYFLLEGVTLVSLVTFCFLFFPYFFQVWHGEAKKVLFIGNLAIVVDDPETPPQSKTFSPMEKAHTKRRERKGTKESPLPQLHGTTIYPVL